MDFQDRYEAERQFTDAAAEKTLSSEPKDLRPIKVGTFEDLCRNLHYLRSIPDFCGDLKGKKLLEIGCGNGWISLRFAMSGARVWGCDISPKVLEVARRYAHAASLEINYEPMICEEMTYEDNFFDIVFMHMALHHCDVPAAAKQIRRVLKPGGKAIIVEDYAYHPIMRAYRWITPRKHTHDEHPLAEKDIRDFSSDFSSCSTGYYGLFDLFETSNNSVIRSLIPTLRRLDNFFYSNLTFVQKYSRLVVLKAIA